MIGFLSPALLALGLAVAVPLVLHLFQRQQGPRIVFPALRYLRRAEKENARRIKLRQLLLLLMRATALVLLAVAAARPFLRRGGAGHEPTAAVIVLDNSMSTGLVVGDRRVLDQLKERAMETLARSGADDRFWLIRAGEPWEAAVPGGPAEIARLVEQTEVASNAADIGAALERAKGLLAVGAEERAPEIHLLSDLQASGLRSIPAGEGSPPVVAWAPRTSVPGNTAITAVEVGGGLAPRAGERSLVAATIAGTSGGDPVGVRLSVDGRISAAASGAAGSTVVMPFPAKTSGLVSGWVELDPDALRGDDRRYFVLRVQPPPATALAVPTPFVGEAIDVLVEAGRIRRTETAAAEVVVAPGGVGVDAARNGRTVVVLAPASRLELAAVNRRLTAAGIPWRYGLPTGTGDARLVAEEDGDELLEPLREARLREAYVLEPQSGAGGDSAMLRLADGAPWVIRGEMPGGGRYLIVASPLTAEASSLPTSSAMVPLLDRLTGAWAARQSERTDAYPGQSLSLSPGASVVERPGGVRDTLEAGGRYRVPATPGIYRVLVDERMIDAFAVNPPAVESDPERLDGRQLRAALPGWELHLADDARGWANEIFRRRLGNEFWRPLLLLVLALLLVEALVAASGRSVRAGTGGAGADGSSSLSARPLAHSGGGTGATEPRARTS